VPRLPRSNLALENAHRSGGAARHPFVSVAAIGDYLAEGAITVNARRAITYVNRIATSLLGSRADVLLGRDVVAIAAPASGASPHFARALAEVLERGVEQLLTVNDADATPPFNVDFCRLLPIADGGALILLGETMSPSVSEQLAKARALAGILQNVNQSLEFERVVQLLADHAADLLGGSGARVMMLDDDGLHTASAVGTDADALGQRIMDGQGITGQVVRTRRPARTTDLYAVFGHRDTPSDPADGSTPSPSGVSAIAVPLQVGDRPIGVVMVSAPSDRRFTDHDEQLLITLATHGAIALENARLYRAAAQTARHAGILAATARTLTRDITAESLYAGIARVVTESLRADGFSIHGVDAAHEHAELLHTYGLGADDPADTTTTFWRTVRGSVVRSASPEFVEDIEPARHVWPSALDETGSLAMLPLMIEGRARGLLTLRFRQPHAFGEQERTLLADFSTYVAVAIRNVSLVGDLERRAARLSAVAKVQLAMSRTELADVYAEIYRAVVSSVSDASCFALLLADQAALAFRPQLIVAGGVITRSRALAPAPFSDCAATRALRTGQPVMSDRPVRLWDAHVSGAASAMAFACELAAPMVHGDRTLGVLIVQSHRPDVFTTEDVELLSIIARQAGAAIENARLFEAQGDEREMAEAAARIARVALASTTPAAAAAAILGVVGEVVRFAGAAIGLLDRGEIVYIGALGSAAHARDMRVPLAHSIAGDLLQASADDVPGAAQRAPRSTGPLRDEALAHGGVVLPLAAKSHRLGVLVAAAPPGGVLPSSGLEALRRLAPSIALAMDVQLLGEGERRQRERERMLATALATMDQPVFVLSLDRRVLYANDAAVHEYGYSLDDLTTMSIDMLVASAVPIRAGDDLSSGPAHVVLAEHVHRRRDGSQFPATVALSFIRQDSGAPIGHVLSVRNLTGERRVAEQLRQSEKLAALGELVAGVAHELNNPLAGISAFAQLLLEEQLNDDQRESARLIKREADRAVSVIRDLLLFSRKSGPSSAPVDLNALIQLTLRLRSYSLRSSGVEVETHLDPTLPDLAGDDQKLQQVILNLIVNAEYAMRRSAAKRLVIRTARVGDAAVTELSDTGAGMSEETLQRVFEPFFTTKPAGDGTGLGLSVSYGIIEAHGGTITVESAPGRGTTFRIVLPARATPARIQGDSA
jgi:PAS domain S-box-containing protein